MKNIKVFSSGGGKQSTAVLVLTAQGKLNYDLFVMADVGADSENPATIDYVNSVAIPYAKKHNIPFVILQKNYAGQPDTLLNLIHRNKKCVPIPARLKTGAPANRTCTVDFKIDVVDKYLRKNGYTDVICGLGISTDEYTRARTTEWQQIYKTMRKKREYPLIDLRINRAGCEKIIAAAGLPPAPKSACWFCPFHSQVRWQDMRKNEPDLFYKACELDELLRARRLSMGRDEIYIHPRLVPLRAAVGYQPDLWDETENCCESGYCMV